MAVLKQETFVSSFVARLAGGSGAPPKEVSDDLETLFCSKLIAAAYKDIGLIAKHRQTSDFLPKHFCQQYDDYLDLQVRTRIDSNRLVSPRLDSPRLDSTRRDSTRRDSTGLDSTGLDSTRLGLPRLGLTRLDSTRLDSTRLGLPRLGLTRLDSTRLDSA